MSIAETIPFVLSASKQFSSWNSDDPNLKIIMCPKNRTRIENEIWRKYVEISTRAVLDQKNFKKETDNILAMHFSSGMVPWWVEKANMKESNPSIGGLKIDSASCLRVWNKASFLDSNSKWTPELARLFYSF